MNPLKHPAAHQIPENDVEKRGEGKESSVNVSPSENSQDSSQLATTDIAPTPVLLRGRLARWNAKVEGLAGLGMFFGVHSSSVEPDPEFKECPRSAS